MTLALAAFEKVGVTEVAIAMAGALYVPTGVVSVSVALVAPQKPVAVALALVASVRTTAQV